MKKDIDIYSLAVLEGIDMALDQPLPIEEFLTDAEAQKFKNDLNKEYVKTISNAHGREFDSAKAMIKYIKQIVDDEDIAVSVFMKKVDRMDFEYKDAMEEMLQINYIKPFFQTQEVYENTETALGDIAYLAKTVADTHNRIVSQTSATDKNLARANESYNASTINFGGTDMFAERLSKETPDIFDFITGYEM